MIQLNPSEDILNKKSIKNWSGNEFLPFPISAKENWGSNWMRFSLSIASKVNYRKNLFNFIIKT